MSADELIINGQKIARNTRCTINLPMPDLYTHSRLYMPVQVLRGRREGPTLLVSAAVHGDEINGLEIIHRLLSMIRLNRLRGTLIAVPVVNVYGLISKSRYSPDRRDLNRCFPGSERGSLTGRLANLFLQEIVTKIDYGIDLHTGAIHRSNLPQIRTDLSIVKNRQLAEAFGAPVVVDSKPIEGSLRAAIADRPEVTLLLYEGGEALRFDELAIRAGVRGVIAVMRNVGMLAPSRRKILSTPVIIKRSSWMRAPQSGIMRGARPLGAQVSKEETLAAISDPFGKSDSAVLARFSGIIIGRSNLPLVNEGDALFHVAQVPRPGELEEQVEEYHGELADMDELADPYELPDA